MNRQIVTNKSLISIIIRRAIIVLCYSVVFALFLYAPLLRQLFTEQKSLNICAFSETVTPEAISIFEKETGIKVNITYVEMDEQLHAKFLMNGAAGYDVVNISDYIVQALRTSNQLAPINKEALPSLERLDRNIVHLLYDPDNQFSVPHKWYVYGLVYDKEFFKQQSSQMSLAFIFEPPRKLAALGFSPTKYRICMLDDARDAMFLACIYLFGRVTNLSDNEFNLARDLLIRQKKWVEAYTLHSAQYFLFSGVTPVAIMSSNYMRKIYEASSRYHFAIPKEGSMLIVENLAIPATSKKIDLAHQFINFMLRDDIAILNSNFYGFNSANWHANQVLDAKLKGNKHLFPVKETFKNLYIPLLPEVQKKLIEDRWLEVGFA
jgi:spermidine/putrescine transport system substrate-binding protein